MNLIADSVGSFDARSLTGSGIRAWARVLGAVALLLAAPVFLHQDAVRLLGFLEQTVGPVFYPLTLLSAYVAAGTYEVWRDYIRLQPWPYAQADLEHILLRIKHYKIACIPNDMLGVFGAYLVLSSVLGAGKSGREQISHGVASMLIALSVHIVTAIAFEMLRTRCEMLLKIAESTERSWS